MYKAVVKNASITFISRVLGFIRDIVLSRYVGVSWQMDAFLIVFKLPNFFRRLLAEGAFTQSLVPAVINTSDAQNLLQHVYGYLIMILILLSIPFMLYPGLMLSMFTYGLSESSSAFMAAKKMLPWVFPYLSCMACCGFYSVQLNIHRKYMLVSALPIVLNLSLIMGGIYYGYEKDIMCLAYAVFLSGLLQVFFCAYASWQIRGVVLPRYPSLCTEIIFLIQQASSAFAAQVVTYCSAVLDLLLVSFLVEGSLSWLYYAERLALLPVGVISVVLANIILPDLSKSCKKNDLAEAGCIIKRSLMIVLVISVPFMLGGFVLAREVVTLLFSSEKFSAVDVENTTVALKTLCMAMPAMMINRVLTVVPYALSQAQVQLKIALITLITSASVGLLLLPYLGYLSISLGMFVSAWVTMYCLYRFVSKAINITIIDRLMLQKILVAAVMMMLVLIAIKLSINQKVSRVCQAFLFILQATTSITVYCIVLWYRGFAAYLA